MQKKCSVLIPLSIFIELTMTIPQNLSHYMEKTISLHGTARIRTHTDINSFVPSQIYIFASVIMIQMSMIIGSMVGHKVSYLSSHWLVSTSKHKQD